MRQWNISSPKDVRAVFSCRILNNRILDEEENLHFDSFAKVDNEQSEGDTTIADQLKTYMLTLEDEVKTIQSMNYGLIKDFSNDQFTVKGKVGGKYTYFIGWLV